MNEEKKKKRDNFADKSEEVYSCLQLTALQLTLLAARLSAHINLSHRCCHFHSGCLTLPSEGKIVKIPLTMGILPPETAAIWVRKIRVSTLQWCLKPNYLLVREWSSLVVRGKMGKAALQGKGNKWKDLHKAVKHPSVYSGCMLSSCGSWRSRTGPAPGHRAWRRPQPRKWELRQSEVPKNQSCHMDHSLEFAAFQISSIAKHITHWRGGFKEVVSAKGTNLYGSRKVGTCINSFYFWFLFLQVWGIMVFSERN